ncbi:hypothetical protein BDV25DRAFT_135376 [Aspergillus avenaceus]|uniref:Uncharacterized protein n=1 Tax=Aspergillus avenaceus TaxID=36643 RepID=A0A5N6U8V6_ASPAV|nr:hypothetical protein BDV25DRAFT_135376 [Aspergillus avenaceus]
MDCNKNTSGSRGNTNNSMPNQVHSQAKTEKACPSLPRAETPVFNEDTNLGEQRLSTDDDQYVYVSIRSDTEQEQEQDHDYDNCEYDADEKSEADSDSDSEQDEYDSDEEEYTIIYTPGFKPTLLNMSTEPWAPGMYSRVYNNEEYTPSRHDMVQTTIRNLPCLWGGVLDEEMLGRHPAFAKELCAAVLEERVNCVF